MCVPCACMQKPEGDVKWLFWLGWLASELPGSTCQSPGAEVTGMCIYAQLFIWVLEFLSEVLELAH